jgi:hypothetical protein
MIKGWQGEMRGVQELASIPGVLSSDLLGGRDGEMG